MQQSTTSLSAVLTCSAALLFGAAQARAADDAVSVNSTVMSPWQTRLALGDAAMRRPGAASAGLAPSANLMGDYYFGRSLAGLPGQSGFRATSGLIFGPRAVAPSTGFARNTSFNIGSQPFGRLPVSTARDANDSATVPYLGIGYTGLKPHSGWRYNADLGLVAQSPGGMRMVGSQSLDDAIREMRLAPVMQLGASYSF